MTRRKPDGRQTELTLINRREMAEQYQRRSTDRQFPSDFAGKTDFTPGQKPGKYEQQAIDAIEKDSENGTD
jgi:hypothetical protein